MARFRRYEFALKTLRSVAGAGATTGVVNAPPGSVLERYQQYKSGSTVPSYPRADTSLPGGFITVSIVPFGFGEDNPTIVELSQRASGQYALFGGVANLGITTTLPDDAIARAGYIPAKATVFAGSGTTTNGTSQITGVPYKKRNGESYTAPFGAVGTGAAAREYPRRQAIATAVAAGGGNRTVTFQPEQLKGG